MGKRGGIGLSYYAMIGLVLAAILILTMYDISARLMRNDVIENIVISRDTALLIETMHATPYDVFYTYPGHLDNRELTIKNNIVETGSLGGLPGAMESYYFHPSTYISLTHPEKIPAHYFIFLKKGMELSIGINTETSDELPSQIFLKETASFKITYDSNIADQSTLKNFAETLKGALKDKDFNITENEPTIHLHLQSSADTTTIYYSLLNRQETETVAKQFVKSLPENLLSAPSAVPLEETYAIVIIDIHDIDYLRQTENNKQLAMRLAASLNKVYK